MSPRKTVDDRSDSALGLVVGGGSERRGAAVLVERHWADVRRRPFVAPMRRGGGSRPDGVAAAARTAHQLRDSSSAGPWLCTVVRNEARSQTRRRTVPVDGFDYRPDLASHPRPACSKRGGVMGPRLSPHLDDCRQLLRLVTAFAEARRGGRGHRETAGLARPTRQRCLDQLRRNLPQVRRMNPYPGADLGVMRSERDEHEGVRDERFF